VPIIRLVDLEYLLCIERLLGTTFSLDDDLASIITGIKSDRDDIERLKRLVDGEREYNQNRNEEDKAYLTILVTDNTEMGDGILTLSQGN
jgi:hypothetical protein